MKHGDFTTPRTGLHRYIMSPNDQRHRGAAQDASIGFRRDRRLRCTAWFGLSDIVDFVASSSKAEISFSPAVSAIANATWSPLSAASGSAPFVAASSGDVQRGRKTIVLCINVPSRNFNHPPVTTKNSPNVNFF